VATELTRFLAAKDSPVSSPGGAAYLVSALVEKPGHSGHRAQVGAFASREDAIGSSLALWQTDGWSVSSYDCKLCDTVVPKDSPVSSSSGTDRGFMPKFALGDRVRKRSGSSWQGRVVGFYTTALTLNGYAVESEREPGSVQIYPEAALENADV
jgi:hypothetical protein